jgi:hypothetical protein
MGGGVSREAIAASRKSNDPDRRTRGFIMHAAHVPSFTKQRSGATGHVRFLVAAIIGAVWIAAASAAQAQLIPSDRRIAWSPGIPGGIPQYKTVCANVKDAPFRAKGDGVADDTAAIQRAIDRCKNGQAVFLPAGTYRLTAELQIIDKSIVLRGEGQRKTWLRNESGSGNILSIGSRNERHFPVRILDGYTKDSTKITLKSASSFGVGDHLVHEADALRLAHVDAAPGDDQLHRLGESHDEREPHRHAVTADDVPAPLERSELRVLGGDADVGEQRRLQAGC